MFGTTQWQLNGKSNRKQLTIKVGNQDKGRAVPDAAFGLCGRRLIDKYFFDVSAAMVGCGHCPAKGRPDQIDNAKRTLGRPSTYDLRNDMPSGAKSATNLPCRCTGGIIVKCTAAGRDRLVDEGPR